MTEADWVKIIDAGIRGAIGGGFLFGMVYLVRVLRRRKG